MNLKRIILLLLITGFLISCRNEMIPLDESLLDRAKDMTAPLIVIDSPATDSVYGQSITVSGTVSDDGSVLPSLHYQVVNSLGEVKSEEDVELVSTELDSGVEGEFSFILSTENLSSDILVKLSATDWNGNVQNASPLKLLYPGNGIPSLSVDAGNAVVTVDWDAIDSAEEYIVYYQCDGRSYNDNSASQISFPASELSSRLPLQMDRESFGVQNSVSMFIKVVARGVDSDVWSSRVINRVPLSSFSLTPRTEGYEDRIVLEWPEVTTPYNIPVVYQVWRSSNGISGDYILLSNENQKENKYTDALVSESTLYFYKVAVSGLSSQLSTAVAGQINPVKSTDPDINLFLKNRTIIDIAVNGSYVFVLEGFNHGYYYTNDRIDLVSLDISNPSHPVERDRLNISTTDGDRVEDLICTDDRVYVAISDKLIAVNSENISSLEIESDECKSLSGITGLAMDEDRKRLYISRASKGLAVLNLSGPSPILVESIDLSCSLGGLCFYDNWVYAYSLDSFYAIDCNSADAPIIRQTTTLSDDKLPDDWGGEFGDFDIYNAIAVSKDSETVFLAAGSNFRGYTGDENPFSCIWTYEILESHSLSTTANKNVEIDAAIMDITVQGSRLFLSSFYGEFLIVDINGPSLRQRVLTDGVSMAVAAKDNTVYIADRTAGLSVISLNNMINPTAYSLSAISGTFSDAVLTGGNCYLAESSGLDSYSMSSAGNLSSSKNLSVSAVSLAYSGEYGFAGTGSNTLYLLQGRTDPDLIGSIICDGPTGSLDLWGDYLYVSQGSFGVGIYDISTPGNPRFIKRLRTAGDVTQVRARGDRLYIAQEGIPNMMVYSIESLEDPSLSNTFTTQWSAIDTYFDVGPEYLYIKANEDVYILPLDRLDSLESALNPSSLDSGVGYIDSGSSALRFSVDGDILTYAYKQSSLKSYFGVYSLAEIQNPQQIYLSSTSLLREDIGRSTSAGEAIFIQGYGNNIYVLLEKNLLRVELFP